MMYFPDIFPNKTQLKEKVRLLEGENAALQYNLGLARKDITRALNLLKTNQEAIDMFLAIIKKG